MLLRRFFLAMTLACLSANTYSALECDLSLLQRQRQQTLSCYLNENANSNKSWSLLESKSNNFYKVTAYTYLLTSQAWPKASDNISQLWTHHLVIYKPDVVKTSQALLVVNGGTKNLNLNGHNPPPHKLNFARIAAETNSIVIDLQDVPNQYITLADRIPRMEDGLVAYSWNRYLQDPDQNMFWPLHLPMTKSVIMAMDAVQAIMKEQYSTNIERFVVSGASKRGWATWLAALSDDRINAIVPVVIDILNTKENLKHIYSSYGKHWPLAFYDYEQQKITDQIDTPQFAELMKIEDPLSYLVCNNCNVYRKRLRIPKYIISASGDDFFVPDSLNLYLDKLPGENSVRMVPNQSHFIDSTIVEESLLGYYRYIVKGNTPPTIQWRTDNKGRLLYVSTNEAPISIRQWIATNTEARDFRKSSNIIYKPVNLQGNCIKFYCLFPARYQTKGIKGWQSTFIEATFADREGKQFVVTSPAYISQSAV